MQDRKVVKIQEEHRSRRYLTINWWDEGNAVVRCPLNRTGKNAQPEMGVVRRASYTHADMSHQRRARRSDHAKTARPSTTQRASCMRGHVRRQLAAGGAFPTAEDIVKDVGGAVPLADSQTRWR